MAKRIFNWWLRLAYRLLLRLTVEGWKNVPDRGPVILMINHIHALDPFVAAASMPRPMTAMSKVENFSIPVFGLIFKLYGAIPVRRGQIDRQALKQALNVLKGDVLLLLAPEGTRSPNQQLQPALNGLAYIAYRSHAAIVPTAITGTPNFGRNVKRLRRNPVHIKLGNPFYLHTADASRRLDRETLSIMTTEAMYQLAALLPPEHRGVYADLAQATEDYIQFPDGSSSNLSYPVSPPPTGEPTHAAPSPLAQVTSPPLAEGTLPAPAPGPDGTNLPPARGGDRGGSPEARDVH